MLSSLKINFNKNYLGLGVLYKILSWTFRTGIENYIMIC